MKQLVISHRPGLDGAPAHVRVSYCQEAGTTPLEREAEFTFALTPEQRALIQWYLEEYLIYPWGEFCTRAQGAEQTMAQVGERLFEAVFCNREMQTLYGRVASDLANTR